MNLNEFNQDDQDRFLANFENNDIPLNQQSYPSEVSTSAEFIFENSHTNDATLTESNNQNFI